MNLLTRLRKSKWRDAEEALAPAPAALKARVIDALRTVYDPEIPVNIYDLGLVYELSADEVTGTVHIKMTLTAPGCPVAQSFPSVVERAVEAVDGVEGASVELVWDPPWSRERINEAARLELGIF